MTNTPYNTLNYLSSYGLDNDGNPSSAQWHDAYNQQKHLFNLSLNYGVSELSSLYLRGHKLFEDDRPVRRSLHPVQAYLGSDEHRTYLRFRTRV